MSRTYVMQSVRIAAAAARMKVDVNFLGVVDNETVRWLQDNHVFLRDVWPDGEWTVRRLQRLYHRLCAGDQLFMDGGMHEDALIKAATYAHERQTKVVICLIEGQSASQAVCAVADIVVSRGGLVEGQTGSLIELESDANLEGWVGAMALCLMNGLNIEQLTPFCQRAAVLEDLPWYDQVAY